MQSARHKMIKHRYVLGSNSHTVKTLTIIAEASGDKLTMQFTLLMRKQKSGSVNV